MCTPCAVVCAIALFAEDVPTRFVQLSPQASETLARSDGQDRAVLLIHGFTRYLRRTSVKQARFHDWQEPDSTLVQALAKDSDVYAFAYAQTVPVEEIAAAAGLVDGVNRLKGLGYSQIVLVGHSAGGLVARQFVEDQNYRLVTKVIQIASPNAGSTLAEICEGPVPKTQEPFLKSLTKEARKAFLKERTDKMIPHGVQFVSVVCRAGTSAGRLPDLDLSGDLVISCETQWPFDLQEQGIPAVALRTNHESAMRGRREAEIIASLVARDKSRWDADRTEQERSKILP
jgi:pimeloyl-ACP methyl ester carboxylesterase